MSKNWSRYVSSISEALPGSRRLCLRVVLKGCGGWLEEGCSIVSSWLGVNRRFSSPVTDPLRDERDGRGRLAERGEIWSDGRSSCGHKCFPFWSRVPGAAAKIACRWAGLLDTCHA
ncbi:MAG: hypothetical protein WBG89_06060, partial [Ornithinimicrobium sp.]